LDNIGIDLPRWVQSLPDVTRKTMDKERRKQYRTVLALDDAIQSIFNALNTKGILENTVVIYQSDNGYSFGSHRWVRKRCEYEEAIHVHMMVHYPGIATRNIGKLESNVDLAPTIADIAGVIPDVPVDGKSWKPLILEQPTKWRTGILIHGVKDSTKLPITYWGIRTTAWKYVEIVETGEKELYDLQNDPYELTNLANEPGYEMRQANLATKLANLRTS
jgi:arylsulfatase A-like enzyme